MAKRPGTTTEARFDVGDDLIWQAAQGGLVSRGPIQLKRSGRIGPVVEVMFAREMLPAEYRLVTLDIPFAEFMDDAMSKALISGQRQEDKTGVFPLVRHDPLAPTSALWDQWALHAENAAVANGFKRSLVSGLIGAMIELQDNVYEHSEAVESGLVAYAASASAFEFVVADAGIGMLESLRKNPEFSGLKDSGHALRVAVSDGASRYDRSTGHGFGMGTLFKALAESAGELRFRSGDHAMTIRGDRPSLTGEVEIVQKAWLAGLIISVRCTPSGRACDS